MSYSNKVYNIKKRLNKIESDIAIRKDLKGCVDKLETLLVQPYCKIEVKSLLAKAYLEIGREKDALDLFKSLYDATNNGEYLISIVHLLMDIGYVNEARKYIDESIYSDEELYSLGVYNKRMGNYDEAINYFEKLNHTVKEEDAYIEIAVTYMIKGDNEMAKKYYYKLLNSTKRYQALIRLMKIALYENDPNIETLFKKFDIDNCYHQGDLKQYKRCIVQYEYMKGKANNNQDIYMANQLNDYTKEKVLEHVKKKHVDFGKLYKFYNNVDLGKVYDYCLKHLDNIVLTDDKKVYIVEMPYDVGYLLDMKTNIVEVIVLASTDKILTFYPITKVGKYNIDKIKERNRGNNEKR